MGLTICENVSHTNDWISGLWSLFAELVERFLDGWNVLVWNVLAFSSINKDVAHLSVGISDVLVDWLDVPNDSGVLSGTSRLFLVQIVEGLFASDGFSVVNGRVSNDDVDVVFSPDSFAVDLKMQLTHA